MPILYYAPGACSLASHVILESLASSHGFKYESSKVALRQPDSPIFKVNPLGRVPTLQLDSGELITENGAILPYLGDLIPAAGLFAAPGSLERTRIQEWIGFLNSDVHFAFRPVYRPEFYSADEASHETIRTQGRTHLVKLFKHIEDKLNGRTWAVGERFTIADAYLGYFLRRIGRSGLPVEEFPNIQAYVVRFEALPAVKAVLEIEARN